MNLLDTNVALHAQDVDFLLVVGLGFPPAHGGILAWGDRYGLAKAVARMEELNKKLHFAIALKPCQALRNAAAKGPSFRLRDDIRATPLPAGAGDVSRWAPARPGVAEAAVVTLLGVAARYAYSYGSVHASL